MSEAPKLALVSVACFERPVTLRLPFRFGHATVTAAPQAFVRATIDVGGVREEGWSAELMIPKWFDKSPLRSNAQNVDDLRRSLTIAARAYAGDRSRRTAFGHAAARYAEVRAEGHRQRLNALAASYGPALVDRAVLDALLRLRGESLVDALSRNVPALDTTLTPDIEPSWIAASLASAAWPDRIAMRHTVGLLDPLTRPEAVDRPADDLPVALDEVVERYRPRHFKLKLAGEPARDAERVARIVEILRGADECRLTLDGNEQFPDLEAVDALFSALSALPSWQWIRPRLLYLEQPLPRAITLTTAFDAGRFPVPLVVDEADDSLDAFAAARAAGYRGVSSKDCKGFYKSLLNLARCRQWNDRGGAFFLTGEDLTAQPGLAVQQDLALACALGLTGVERNGHHYADGFVAQGAPVAERDAFLSAHPGFYERGGDNVRLSIHDGAIDVRSLAAPGFGTAYRPDPSALAPLRVPDDHPPTMTARNQ